MTLDPRNGIDLYVDKFHFQWKTTTVVLMKKVGKFVLNPTIFGNVFPEFFLMFPLLLFPIFNVNHLYNLAWPTIYILLFLRAKIKSILLTSVCFLVTLNKAVISLFIPNTICPKIPCPDK